MRLMVADKKIQENSFSSNEHHIFLLLREIGDTYGNDFVIENWERLMNLQKVELQLGKNHIVEIQIET